MSQVTMLMKSIAPFCLLITICSTVTGAEKVCGDTVGASMIMLNSIRDSAKSAINPEGALSPQATKSSQAMLKHLCASVGDQIGSALAIRTNIRFFGPTEPEDSMVLKMNQLVDGLMETRKEHCTSALGSSEAVKALQDAASKASQQAAEISSFLRASGSVGNREKPVVR